MLVTKFCSGSRISISQSNTCNCSRLPRDDINLASGRHTQINCSPTCGQDTEATGGERGSKCGFRVCHAMPYILFPGQPLFQRKLCCEVYQNTICETSAGTHDN